MKYSQRAFHLAGIVPVAGQPLDFNFPWHDALQPVAANYLAVEHAAVECAYAGCRTIWIVCNDDMQSLIRHRLGDYLQDPRKLESSKFAKFPNLHYREIPIFYVPIHPDDRDKRDCFVWSMIHGAFIADYVSRTVSRWTTPRKFYVSFPYGIYNIKDIYKHRRRLVSDRRTYFSFDGKTAQDGEYLPFTFDLLDVKRFKNIIRKKGTGKYEIDDSGNSDHEYNLKLRPLAERFSARFFDLEDVIVFENIQEDENYELSWYYNISSWDGLCEFLGSEHRKEIRRAPKSLMSYHELSPIGVDVGEESS
jgi:hypothetical protein